jgi:glyoxylase-like metal-dependent hydrolase (beta-lactamase superfamily II)
MPPIAYSSSTPEIRIGALRVTTLFDGWLALDGGAMFGVVPKNLWERKLPADTQNRVKMAMRPLLVRSKAGPVIIEAGVGQAITGKFVGLYGIERPGASLDEQVAAQDVNPRDVKHVILTHLHWDHAGGCCSLKGGKYVPCFENATYHAQEAEWDTAIAAKNVHKASYVPQCLLPLKERGQLRLHAGSGGIVPGIRFELTRGHTQNHAVIWIEDSGESGCFMGDFIETSAHVPLAWISAYDYSAGETLRARQRFYPRFADKNTKLFIYHDPTHAAIKLLRDQDKWGFDVVA